MPDRAAYQIRNGGAPRRVYGARDRIQRESHALVVHTTEGATAKHQEGSAWFTDLRRGRLNIYGGLLRFIEHLARRGVPMETALLIPQWLESYIRDVYGDTPAPAAIPLELVQSGEFRKAA